MTSTADIAPSPPLPALQPFDLRALGLAPQDFDLPAYAPPALAFLPLLGAFRYGAAAADMLTYDVQRMWLSLLARGVTIPAAMSRQGATATHGLAALAAAARLMNLSAMASPEGKILVVDAHRQPFLSCYDTVKAFLGEGLKFPNDADATASTAAQKDVCAIAVTGVGSSALGSAAFAWNVSEALNAPVAAIVSGCAVADVVDQGFGGWWGLALHDVTRRLTQQTLAAAAPDVARIGRGLSGSSPGADARATAPGALRAGCPDSDILHDVVQAAPKIRRLYGHAKGALCLRDALRSLPPERAANLHVTTFGCVVEEETPADYIQILGRFDWPGQILSWGAWPEQWIRSWGSTNTMLPMSMRVGDLVKKDIRAEDPARMDAGQLREAVDAALKALFARDAPGPLEGRN